MHRFLPLAFFLCCFFLAPVLSAQVMYVPDKEAPMSEDLALEKLSFSSSALFSDPDQKRYYVDFEQLRVHVKDVLVRDESGKILINEEVVHLPVNTIYEIDCSNLLPGTYYLELRSFAGIMRKSLQMK
jgi:hypothetical protein